ncbi:MAG: glycosyltransferase [Chloroflexota bacterium]
MKPRVLQLTPQLPYPPEQGTSLRNYNILRGLWRRYAVTLMSFVTEPPSARALDHLSGCDEVITIPAPRRTITTRLLRMLTDRRPDMAHRLHSPAFNQALIERLREGLDRADAFQVVQIEGIELSFAVEIVRTVSPQTKILFDDHNAEYELQRRAYLADRSTPRRWAAAIYSRIQALRLRAYERQICNHVDHVVAVSDKDGRLLRDLGLTTPVSVIPNSIDIQEYVPDEQELQRYDLLFIGKMDYRPNVDAVQWFAQEVWPLLKAQRPDITWAIVGKNPHPRLAYLGEEKGIALTGRVDKVQPYLFGCLICVMPFRVGSGTRLKLIEAMASGRAVVSTTVGAEGFDLRPGEHLLLADDPAAFAEAILNLLADPQRRHELGVAAQRFASQYDWRLVAPRFYRIIDALLVDEKTGGDTLWQ